MRVDGAGVAEREVGTPSRSSCRRGRSTRPCRTCRSFARRAGRSSASFVRRRSRGTSPGSYSTDAGRRPSSKPSRSRGPCTGASVGSPDGPTPQSPRIEEGRSAPVSGALLRSRSIGPRSTSPLPSEAVGGRRRAAPRSRPGPPELVSAEPSGARPAVRLLRCSPLHGHEAASVEQTNGAAASAAAAAQSSEAATDRIRSQSTSSGGAAEPQLLLLTLVEEPTAAPPASPRIARGPT